MTPSFQDATEQLRAVERQRLRALVDKDVPLASRLHADDFQLINPLGGSLSKSEYLGAIAAGEIDYLSWEPGNIEVRIYGDAAVIRYQADLKIRSRPYQTPRADASGIRTYTKGGMDLGK